MEWTLLYAIASMCLTILLVFVYGYLFYNEKRNYFLIWGFGWAFYFLKYFFMALDQQTGASQILFILNHVSSILGGACIIYGTYFYTNKKVGYKWRVAALITIMWIIVGKYIEITSLALILPIYIYQSAAFLYTGISFWKFNNPNNIGGRILGITFVLISINKLRYIVFGTSISFTPFFSTIELFLLTLALVGILIKYLEKNKLKAEAYAERFQLIYEAAPELIVLFDENGIVIDCNSKITEIYGYNKEEIIGQDGCKFLQPDFKEIAKYTIENIIVKGTSVKSEYGVIRKDKQLIDVGISTAPILDSKGKCTGIVSIIQNISEVKRRNHWEIVTKNIYSKLNNFIDLKATLTSVLGDLKSISGCEAVGIRLKCENDYPFFVYEGFSSNFINRDNSICSLDSNGKCIPCLNGNGYELDCMCGKLLKIDAMQI